MSKNYDTLRQLLSEDINECKLILEEEAPTDLLDRINKIIKEKDKEKIVKYTNYEIFLIALNCFNTDCYSYNDTLEILEKVKSKINSWNYNNSRNLIYKFYSRERKNEDRKYESTKELEKLGLPVELYSYRLIGPFMIMDNFLDFKERVSIIDKNDTLFALNNNPKMSPLMKKSIVERAFNACSIENILGLLSDYHNNVIKEQKDRKIKIEKRLKIEQAIEEKLMDGTIKDMKTQIPEKWCIYLNLKVANELLFIILDNIEQDYQKEQSKYQESLAILNKTPLTKYLYEHKINPNRFDPKILEELEQNEETIPNIEFMINTDIDVVDNQQLIITLTKKIRTQIIYLLNNKILSKETIKNNLDKIKTDITKLINNYEILSTIVPMFDFNSKFYNDNILFIDTLNLKQTINVLKEYKFTEQESDYFTYLLSNPALINIFDILLEKSLPLELIFLLGKTNNPLNAIKRILIYQQINTPIIDKNGNLKKDIYDEKRFIISDQELDSYLNNIVNEILQVEIKGETVANEENTLFIEELDRVYLNDKRTYKIGETIISRPKVLKNLNYCINNKMDIRKSFIPVLITGSIYDEKNLFEINSINQIKKLSLN